MAEGAHRESHIDAALETLVKQDIKYGLVGGK